MMPYNFIDLTGQRFGRLTIIKRIDDKRQGTFWLCKCDCGGEKVAETRNLRRGLTQSCGCLHRESTSKVGKGHLEDLVGKRFGMLRVLERADNHGSQTYWRCQCDCGNIVEAKACRLKSGVKTDCGCIARKAGYHKSGIPWNKTHGMTDTRIYRIYHKMRLRCYSKVNPAYPNYGGRGITICPEWLGEHGFENFAKWSFENGYSDNLSIDRKDNDKGYSPENCRWATAKEQANNTRSTVFLTYKGETKPVSEWSEITGIRQDTLTYRKRHGWTDEECIEIPLNKIKGKYRKKK